MNNNKQVRKSYVRSNRKRQNNLRSNRNGSRPSKAVENELWNMSTSMPRSVLKSPFPNCEYVNCVVNFWGNVVDAAAPFVLLEFRLNDLFVPYTGSPISSSGLASAAARYDSYKVRSVRFSVSVLAREQFNCMSGLFLRDAQPSTLITTYQQAVSALTNGPSTCIGTVGLTGGVSRYTARSGRIELSHIVGDPMMYMSDRDFAALVNAGPNQIVWGAFILASEDVSINLANGVTAKITMEQGSCFFSKKINL